MWAPLELQRGRHVAARIPLRGSEGRASTSPTFVERTLKLLEGRGSQGNCDPGASFVVDESDKQEYICYTLKEGYSISFGKENVVEIYNFAIGASIFKP
ncbi:hypothetical protein NDU88_001292 [Pleurodeles waltl]|uniref:Uncharacterized protein n=1 Tax=Pleurodeles waltl TaxID=8319 RepID=A0AAV7VWH0_PLEWA|nr:hypothetical protein NDU88_001292 [Pleurodeles waltl]